MSRRVIDRTVFRDVSWWHWAGTVPLLAAHLLIGSVWAIWASLAMCAVVGIYFLVRIRRLRPWPVQVRIAYLALLAVGLLPGMQWVHWVQLAGTTARATVGYCMLIRFLRLAPFNRDEPLTLSLIRRVLIRDPCVGGLVSWSDGAVVSSGSCSLAVEKTGITC